MLDHDPQLTQSETLNEEVHEEAIDRLVTPTGAHFVRCNFAIPHLDPRTHHVEVAGAVAAPFALNAADLGVANELRTALVTLECAGNGRATMVPPTPGEPWQQGAVSTAAWTGVPLRSLLEKAVVRDDAVEILFEGADGKSGARFSRALPVDAAFDPDVLVALEMNGSAIPAPHGGPVRLIVPGWYGMASVKWLRRIVALTRPHVGPFQTERYIYADGAGRVLGPVSRMRPRALIVTPSEGAEVEGALLVRGWAWSGHAAIDRVLLSVDEVTVEAKLDPSAGPHAWRGFHAELDVAPGHRTILARAIDESGRVQPDEAPWNALGYGNNAVQARRVVVR